MDGSLASVARLFARTPILNKPDIYNVGYVSGRFNLAPIATVTVPKTELNALLLGCKLIKKFMEVAKNNPRLKVQNIYLFSDSTVALSSIISTVAQLKLYFISRVLECQKIIMKYGIKLYHIAGSINIADLGTKILKDSSILQTNNYWTIPFFESALHEWPVEEFEMKKEDYTIIMNPKMVMMKTGVVKMENNIVFKLLTKYMSYTKVKKIISIILLWKTKTINEASKLAEDKLFQLNDVKEDTIISREKKYHMERHQYIYLISREYQYKGAIMKDTLKLVGKNSHLAKLILRDAHIHMASPSHEVAFLQEE